MVFCPITVRDKCLIQWFRGQLNKFIIDFCKIFFSIKISYGSSRNDVPRNGPSRYDVSRVSRSASSASHSSPNEKTKKSERSRMGSKWWNWWGWESRRCDQRRKVECECSSFSRRITTRGSFTIMVSSTDMYWYNNSSRLLLLVLNQGKNYLSLCRFAKFLILKGSRSYAQS